MSRGKCQLPRPVLLCYCATLLPRVNRHRHSVICIIPCIATATAEPSLLVVSVITYRAVHPRERSTNPRIQNTDTPAYRHEMSPQGPSSSILPANPSPGRSELDGTFFFRGLNLSVPSACSCAPESGPKACLCRRKGCADLALFRRGSF